MVLDKKQKYKVFSFIPCWKGLLFIKTCKSETELKKKLSIFYFYPMHGYKIEKPL